MINNHGIRLVSGFHQALRFASLRFACVSALQKSLSVLKRAQEPIVWRIGPNVTSAFPSLSGASLALHLRLCTTKITFCTKESTEASTGASTGAGTGASTGGHECGVLRLIAPPGKRVPTCYFSLCSQPLF